MSRTDFPMLDKNILWCSWSSEHEQSCSHYMVLNNPTKTRTTRTPFCAHYWKRRPPCHKNDKVCPHMKKDRCGECYDFKLLKGNSVFCPVIGRNVHSFQDVCDDFVKGGE